MRANCCIQGNGGANQSLESLLVNLVAFVKIDGAPRVAFKARVEQARRIFQRRALGEGHLHHALVGLARADHPIVRPHGSPSPLPLLDHLGVGLLDESTEPGERLTPPVAQLPDPRVYQLRRRPGFLRSALLHDIPFIPRSPLRRAIGIAPPAVCRTFRCSPDNTWLYSAPTSDSRPNDQNFRTALLVSPPVALAIDIFARSLAEIGRADDEDLEALRPGLVASPRTGRDAHRVPFLELDDLVVDLHPPAPAQDHVHLLLLLVPVAVWQAIAGRDALVSQAGFLDLERRGRRAVIQVRPSGRPS